MVVLVLRVAKVRTGGGDYYLEVATGTGTGIEAAGRWLGSGTPELGLSGDVGPDDLHAVLAGKDPATGQVLGTARHRVRVAAFDMTFAAPKSVSLLYALGDGDVSHAVAEGHASAVGAAMAYVEQRALAVRRRTDTALGPVPAAAEGIAAAGFVHRLSRALDPHLHTHVVVANLGRGPEGQWSALDGRGVYAHASATDALYHAHLRYELTNRLGIAWNPLDRGRADIAGIVPEARREFSRRATQIAAHLAERGATGGRARTVAGHITRADKDRFLGADDLRPQWQDRARAVGLGPIRLEAVLDRAPRRSERWDRSDRQPSAVSDNVRALLGTADRPVTRRDVVRAWCRSLPGGAPARTVEDAADRLLENLEPERGPRGARHGPGVAERRHQPPSRTLDRADSERAEVSRLLARRGIGLDRSGHRSPDVGFGLG
jgi:conjugative relaxase-like TrwC/TraI family protein